MNEGSYGGGFGGQQGYNDNAKTCYACGGFGICLLSVQSHMQVTWRRIVLKAKNATTAVVWDMLAVIAIKLLKRKFVTGWLYVLVSILIIDVNNLDISPVTAPMSRLNRPRTILLRRY